MTALEWKKIIEKPNNSTFLKREKGRSGTGSIYVFSATPAAAKAILKDVEQEYPQNDVEMKIRKRSSEGNTYEIYVWLGEKEKFANEKLAQELVNIAKELTAAPKVELDNDELRDFIKGVDAIKDAQALLVSTGELLSKAKRRMADANSSLPTFDSKNERKIAEVWDSLKNWSIDLRKATGRKMSV